MNQPYDTLHTKTNFKATYDRFEVDTSDANGMNADVRLDNTLVVVTDTTVNVAATKGDKTSVTAVVSTSSLGSDSAFYWQDPSNGDIYRYNYGVEYINNFPYLVQALGGKKIDIKWVRVFKADAKPGNSWIAAKDSVKLTQPIITTVYITNTAFIKLDTAIIVAGDTIVCKHIQIVGKGTAAFGSIIVTGTNVADTYISLKYGTTIWDYFRSSTTSSVPASSQFSRKGRGYSKTMKSHN